MAYFGLVTKLQNCRKDENSDRLYLADCFNEGVIIGPDMKTGDLVLYLPTDGQVDRWFGDKFTLFRKNEDGTEQGGYLENNGHVRAIKLRGNESSGIVISLERVYATFGDQHWKDGDKVNTINEKEFCRKYIPKRKAAQNTPKTSYKGRKAEGVTYPEFAMHTDTEQLAYNLDKFRPGDIVNLSLKMHGTSSRHMRTVAQMPRGFFRKLFHLKAKTKPVYICGTRRTVITPNSIGYYGTDEFRMKHHKEIGPYVEEGMEVFGEIVGYYGPNETDIIMPIGDNTKVNDKAFVKEFGKRSIFNYGCKPGESKLYVYRIEKDGHDYSPEEIIEWCNKAGVNHVPYIDTFVFTTTEDLINRINKYFEDLHDPIGKTHIKEGVVVRILNRATGWKAYKSKTYEFKIIEGIIKENSTIPDMEEAQEEILDSNS